MCRLFAITSQEPQSPMVAMEALNVMREGHDGSGVGLFLRDLSGPFEDMKNAPILSGIFTDKGLKRLDSFGDRIHDAMDRATIGIMTASLVIGSSIVMTIAGGPTLFGVSLLTYCGFVGYLIAFVNSLWVIFSIWRSGRR